MRNIAHPSVKSTDQIAVTLFPTEGAQRKKAAQLTLHELADLIQKTTKPTKAELPWIKLATFGAQRTKKNSLRSNDNMISFGGIECDYDEKQISFEQAQETIKKVRLNALVYTTSSYKPDAPKWRILAPLAEEIVLPSIEGLSGEDIRRVREERTAIRARLVARINGLFGGTLCGVSFVLSQGFYFGGLDDNPSHRAIVVNGGDYIDQRPDLDAGAIGKRGKKDKAAAEPKTKADIFERAGEEETSGPGSGSRADIAQMFAEIHSGENYHENIRDLAIHFAKTGMEIGAVKNLLYGAMDASEGPHDERWEARRNNPEGNSTQGVANLVDSAFEKVAEDGEAEKVAALPPLVAYSYNDLRKLPLESVAWSVEDFVLDGAVTGYFGDGGTGKDLTAFQLAIASISDAKWLGREVKQGRTLYLPCEDDWRELRRREEAISWHYKQQGKFKPRSDDLKVIPMIGKNTIIGSIRARTGLVKAEPAYEMLKKEIANFKPQLVIVPNRVHLFSCNQISDSDAIQCLSLLHALCEEFGCAILMPAHPSLAGMSSGAGTSGSVQWSNNVRLRLFLSRLKPEKDQPEDADARTLQVMKANWSAIGQTINLRYSEGVFVSEGEEEKRRAANAGKTPYEIEQADWARAEAEFLRLLDKHMEQGSKVNAAPTAHTFAPALFIKDPDCSLKGKTGKLALRRAMDRLFKKNSIAIVTVGPPSHARTHIERVGLKVVK